MRVLAAAAASLALSLALPLRAQAPPSSPSPSPPPSPSPDDGWNPAIRRGVLDDGISYFVLGHSDPPGRFSARLMLRAGSLAEADDERGLMHLLEHLGFEGSEHFAAGEMGRRVEGSGMRFGPDLNAFTSYDGVRYELELPSDPQSLTLALTMLRDWAGGATLTDEAIEKERGVVLAEKRLSGDAGSRLNDLDLETALAGTRQVSRHPIGTEDVLRHASPEAIRALYRRWWHPGLMAVVLVGDFDAVAVESELRQIIGAIPRRDDAPPRLPDCGEPSPGVEARVVQDEALGAQTIRLSWSRRQAPVSSNPAEQRRRDLVDAVARYATSARLSLRASAGALSASEASFGLFDELGDVEILRAQAGALPDRLEEGVTSVAAEMMRLRDHGLLPGELARATADVAYGYVRSLQRSTSGTLCDVIAGAFAQGEFVRSRAAEIALVERLRDTIGAEDLLAWYREAAAAPRRTVLVSGPGPLPSEDAIRAAFERGLQQAGLAQVTEAQAADCLVARIPDCSRVLRRRAEASLAGAEWLTWPNGLRMLVVPTANAPDEVLFGAWRRDDVMSRPLEDRCAGAVLPAAFARFGTTGASFEALRAWQQSHRAKLRLQMGNFGWTLQGEANADVDPLFERIHALFTSPTIDPQAFGRLRQGVVQQQAEAFANPMQRLFFETERTTLGDAPSWRRPTPDELAAVKPEDVARLWASLRADASQWTFVAVGSTTPDAVAIAGSRWLGTLPGASEPAGRLPFPEVPHMKPEHVARSVEMPAEASLAASGCMLRHDEGALPSREILMLADVLEERLRRRLRDEKGTTYVARVGVSSLDRHPSEGGVIALADLPLGLGPEMSRLVRRELGDLATRGPSATETALVRGQALQDLADDGRSNSSLLDRCMAAVARGESPETASREAARVARMTPDDLRRVARRWFDLSRTFDVAVVPSASDAPPSSPSLSPSDAPSPSPADAPSPSSPDAPSPPDGPSPSAVPAPEPMSPSLRQMTSTFMVWMKRSVTASPVGRPMGAKV